MGWLGQNESMALTVYNYTDYLLEHQRADGFLGPAENPDPWPRMMIAYAFQQYSELNASDPRPVPALHRYFRFLWAQYNNATFRPEQWGWNYVRIVDMQTTVMWLYDNHATAEQQQFLLDLNEILYNKSADIKAYYRSAAFPHEDVASRGTMLTHGVNSAMAFKSAAVWYRQSADPDDIASTYERHAQMDQYHGQASGIFSCVSRTTTASTVTVPARSPHIALNSTPSTVRLPRSMCLPVPFPLSSSPGRAFGGQEPVARHRDVHCGGGDVLVQHHVQRAWRPDLRRAHGAPRVQRTAGDDDQGHGQRN